MNIVKIENLVRKFDDVTAVDKIDLEIQSGEIYGLLGPNGAGKSTIINMICGLLRPSKGKILILGKDTTKYSNYTKSNIGIVPQDIAIYEELTSYDNVKFFASLYGIKGKELSERVLEALEFVGLSENAKERTGNFSGGMKRRLNIACAIAHRPKLIIMDEPTVGIDPQSRNHILKSVRKLNEMGSTIIYTSHYMEEVEEICSKIAIIDHGKLVAEGTKEELKSMITDTDDIYIKIDNIEDVKIEELEAISGIKSVSIENKNIKISVDRDANNFDKIILYFTKNNISIRNIETKVPDLETVFLTLTGRKLRD